MPVLSDEERTRFEAHAASQYPREACGALLVNGRERRLLCWENAAHETRVAYSVTLQQMLHLDEFLRAGWSVAALLHSHVNAPAYLSGDDRRRARYWPKDVVHGVLSVRGGHPADWCFESVAPLEPVGG